MHEFRYRTAQVADAAELAGLRREGEAGGASAERMRRYLAGEHHPQQALAPRTMLVALDGERPVGYAAGHLTRRYGCEGELQWIYVLAEYRGAGVAPELLRRLAAWFVERGARRVCVDVGDEHAGRFYRRHGARDLVPHWLVWDDIEAVPNPATSGDGPHRP